ncbi:MAG: cobalamin-binding protein [Thermoprotei archaeon]
MRICSLVPGATEILYLLGLGDQLVGVSDDCDYPPQVRQKPIISKSSLYGKNYSARQIHGFVQSHKHSGLSIYDVDMGQLKEMEPDLIFTQRLCEVCAVPYSQVLSAAKVLDYGPKVVSLQPRTIEDVLDNILLIGRLTRSERRAQHLVYELKKRVDYIRSKVGESNVRPRVLNLEWTDPPMAGGLWIPEIIDIAGGIDGIAKTGGWAVKLDWETIASYQPEVVVVTPCGRSLEESLAEARALQKIPQWENLPATRNGRVYAANSKWYFSRSGPRLVVGLEIMAEILHPELFSNLAPPDTYAQLNSGFVA